MLGPRDLIWSLIPLVLISIVIAAIGAQCSVSPGGPTIGPAPHFDATAALHSDAVTMDFPIRQPTVPAGWQSNSGSHDDIAGPDGGRVTTVGYLTDGGRYLAYLQSNASEQALARFVDADLTATGAKQLAGHTWVVYTDPGKESSWVTDLGSVRVLIHGAGNPDEYTRLAEAVTAASPIPR
jgi:hypothetical protein